MGTPPQPVPFSTLKDGDLFQWPGGTTARQRVDRTHYRSYPDVGGAGHSPVRPLSTVDPWVVPLRRWEPIGLDAPNPNATAAPPAATNDPTVTVFPSRDTAARAERALTEFLRASSRKPGETHITPTETPP
jgi:hypothetical protein